MNQLYAIRASGGSYDDAWETTKYVTDDLSKAEAYCEKMNAFAVEAAKRFNLSAVSEVPVSRQSPAVDFSFQQAWQHSTRVMERSWFLSLSLSLSQSLSDSVLNSNP